MICVTYIGRSLHEAFADIEHSVLVQPEAVRFILPFEQRLHILPDEEHKLFKHCLQLLHACQPEMLSRHTACCAGRLPARPKFYIPVQSMASFRRVNY